MLLIRTSKGLKMLNKDNLVRSQMYLTENEINLLIMYYEDLLPYIQREIDTSIKLTAVLEFGHFCKVKDNIENRLTQLKRAVIDE